MKDLDKMILTTIAVLAAGATVAYFWRLWLCCYA